jgi:predicted nucleotidyltransferase
VGLSSYPEVYPEVDALLEVLLASLRRVLGDKLIGLYVFGSLAVGDFDVGISDVDLVAALDDYATGEDLDALAQMHTDIVTELPTWADRVEVAYIPLAELRVYNPDYEQPRVSPGEPFHVGRVGSDWVRNRAVVRDHGITVFGPDPATLIDPVSRAELLANVRDNAIMWRHKLRDEPPERLGGRAYAVLTLCRLLYGRRHDAALASKRVAAEWTMAVLPEHSALIDRALAIRADPTRLPETAITPTDVSDFAAIITAAIEGAPA